MADDEIVNIENSEASKALESAVIEADEAKLAAEKLAMEEAAKKAKEKEEWGVKQLKARLAKVTGKLKEQEEENAKLKTTKTPTPEEAVAEVIESKAQARAIEIAAQAKFNEDTNRVIVSGTEEFPDFGDKIQSLKGALLDPADAATTGVYLGVVHAILETSDGDSKVSAKLIHALGSDPEMAERLAKLSPVKLGRELAKLAEQEPPEPVSGVKKPPTVVVGNRSANHTPIDPSDPMRGGNLSTKDWMDRRRAQVAEQQKAGVRMR